MPSTYNLPRATGNWNQMDINTFNKLPFHLATLGAKFMPRWQRWAKVVGERKWEQNQGTVLRGINAEPSPVGRQQFFPNPITTQPLRDVHETREVAEEAIVYRHNYESPYINFNGPFADFRRNQIPFAMKDLTMQIATANDVFIRTAIFHKCPYVLIAGKATTGAGDGFDGDDFVSAPSGVGSADGSTAKTTAWIQQALAYVGNAPGNLSYRLAKRAGIIAKEDLQIVPFEGSNGMPKDNEILKGKYMFMGANEAFENFEFDDDVLAQKSQLTEFLHSSWTGPVGANSIWQSERFPLRIAIDGTFPAPQLWELNPASYNYGKTVPNPAYINAPFEVCFVLGDANYEAIKVGPPPSEFASGSMSSKKFAQLEWNGEVRITDNILINIGTPDVPNQVTNKYGEFVQLIADTTHGIIPIDRRAIFAIIYRRARVSA